MGPAQKKPLPQTRQKVLKKPAAKSRSGPSGWVRWRQKKAALAAAPLPLQGQAGAAEPEALQGDAPSESIVPEGAAKKAEIAVQEIQTDISFHPKVVTPLAPDPAAPLPQTPPHRVRPPSSPVTRPKNQETAQGARRDRDTRPLVDQFPKKPPARPGWRQS